MISQFIDNVWWDENSKINGKYAVVKSFKCVFLMLSIFNYLN